MRNLRKLRINSMNYIFSQHKLFFNRELANAGSNQQQKCKCRNTKEHVSNSDLVLINVVRGEQGLPLSTYHEEEIKPKLSLGETGQNVVWGKGASGECLEKKKGFQRNLGAPFF